MSEIKFYEQKAGAHNKRYTHSIFGDESDAKEELIRLAECDRNGNNDEEIDDQIEMINEGRNYIYDLKVTSFEICDED